MPGIIFLVELLSHTHRTTGGVQAAVVHLVGSRESFAELSCQVNCTPVQHACTFRSCGGVYHSSVCVFYLKSKE